MIAVFVWTVGDLVAAVSIGLLVLGTLIAWAVEWWNESYGGRK